MHMNLDPFLVDKIVDEVKSQGVFDQFRKDSMSDVDTKPAYQNLRQRVETTVSKFLAEQNWTPEMNKNQLREKLRKHITEAGFLDTGVERIVDQVVNPKISTVYQPKIEDIAYAFLGIEKPQVKEEEQRNFTNGDLSIKTDFLLTDLEAVSPDSDKVTDDKPESKEDLLNDSDDKNEEFESPPFEPLEGLGRPVSPEKKEESNHSQLSGISGLTSQDSVEDMKVELTTVSHAEVTQESELSEVSSNSRLSIITNGEDSKSGIKEETDVGISEEAQMPKFSDNNPSNLESGEPLHFDIKKEEIKFEGTDWKSEKRDYYSYMSETLPAEVTVKMEVDAPNESPPKEQAAKVDEASASSSLTFSTDTQETNKLAEFGKETKSTSDIENNENQQSSITQELDKMHSDKNEKSCSTALKKGDRSSSSSSKKKNSEKGKQGNSENGSSYHSDRRHDSHSPKNHSSSSRSYTSSSYHHRSKSRSHKSKHSRDKDRDRSKERKHRSDKDKSEKNDEYCSDRKKKYRRKSTDSNDDGDTSKDTSKNNSTASIDKIEGGKESNNSNSSSSYSAKTNGSTEGCSNIPTADQISERQTLGSVNFIANYPKPILLDGLLGDNNKGNVELIIGPRVSVFNQQREDSSDDEGPLMYFKETYKERMHYDKIIDNLSKVLSQFEFMQTPILVNCEEGFKLAFQKIGLNIFDVPDTEPVVPNKKDKRPQSQKSNENLAGKKKQCTTTNGKRKKGIGEYYQAAYHVFSDEKICSNNHSLIIDCFNYDNEEHINKKIKTDPFAKVSPTPSELSMGSKENEFIVKNATEKCKDESSAAKRAAAFKANQRYSSEDLYKPRPILGQRSRRRALETEVM